MKRLTVKQRTWILLTGCVLLASLLTGCGTQSGDTGNSAAAKVGEQVKTAGGTYTNLTPAELKPMLDHKDFFLVDVHTPPEGRLPNTDARIPFDQVANRTSELPADKGAKIVLSCRSGSMSSEASATLVKLGYTNIYNLKGGMNAWKDAGYEIVPEGK